MEEFIPGQKAWGRINLPEGRSESYAVTVIEKISDEGNYICYIWGTTRMFLAEELTPMDEEEV